MGRDLETRLVEGKETSQHIFKIDSGIPTGQTFRIIGWKLKENFHSIFSNVDYYKIRL